MKIKRLEICGFKSFVDRTTVHFDHDVTGIVGPNGCGKSNIVDAIRWVMGEQSARHLRGKSMEDVIFNGSETRGPHSFADVAITFDNTDGLTPPEYADYAEITVTRRLDRQGTSEYLINRLPVRLMDVTNLFLGTGIGKRAYSIIEQGRIGYIVSSKPEDRRHLIEEAAGVTKFKARRHAAERKMDLTRQNLLRVSDIISEIERTLASLKRQAQKAERYKKYRAEMRDLELHVASHRWLELTATQRVVSASLDDASATAAGRRTALRVREAELEAERVVLAQMERRVDGAQTRSYELDNQVRLLESQITHHLDQLETVQKSERQMERELGEIAGQKSVLEGEQLVLTTSLDELEAREHEATALFDREAEELERRRGACAETERSVDAARDRAAEADTRLVRAETVVQAFDRRRDEGHSRIAKLEADRDAMEREAVEREQEATALAARLDALRGGHSEQGTRKAEHERELTRLRDEIKASDALLEGLRETVAAERSRLRSLEEQRARYDGIGAGARSLVTRHATSEGSGVLGLLADRLEQPRELTRALAAALGERLSWVVVEDAAAARRAVEFLTAEQGGRATVIPRMPGRDAEVPGASPRGEGVLGVLADLVGCAPEDAALVAHLLGDVLVVRDREVAEQIVALGVSGAPTLVTLDGELYGPDGRRFGGAGEDAAEHLLDLEFQIRELGAALEAREAELARVVAGHGELRTGIASHQAALDAARTETHGTELSIVRTEKDVKGSEASGAAARRRCDELVEEAAELARALARADAEAAEARLEIDAARAARGEADRSLALAAEALERRRAAEHEQAARVTEVRVGAAQARERAEADRGAMERLVRSIDELVARGGRVAADLADAASAQGKLVGEIVKTREELSETVHQAMTAHERLAVERARFDDARAALAAQELGLREVRDAIEAATALSSELMLRERELAMELEHLVDGVSSRYRVDVRRVLGDYHAREIPDATIRDRIEELMRLVERMGEINLTAIDEYEEKSRRYEFLTTQRKDLEDALLQLERAIRQMNRESRRLFKEAFYGINERFKLVFPTMFGGGRAELILTDPNDLLESGVEIVAQPPGKRLGSLELMSGGEKALTAVSLIFAIFQFRPSPFCLLDEVDAPLDEANIGRFSDAVRQMTDRSQFILITHAKRTMEAADILYGVTMEQPGVSKLVSVALTGERRPHRAPDQDVAVA